MKGICETLTISGERALWYAAPGFEGHMPLFVMHCGGEFSEQIGALATLLERAGKKGEIGPFALLAPLQVDWDRDYTPWSAECMPHRLFAGGADAYLSRLEGTLLPAVSAEKGLTGPVYALGYSLGGLAALYGLLRNPERYAGAASVSGALWYPGFEERYMESVPRVPVYCSLGRAEAKVRAAAMRGNAEITQRAAQAAGGFCEWNNGNHFFEIPERIAKAVIWLLSRATGRDEDGRRP